MLCAPLCVCQCIRLTVQKSSIGGQAFVTSHFWGHFSPFFPVPSEIKAATPPGCQITFVQSLTRHGSRNPTAAKILEYKALIQRIKKSVSHYGKGVEFIHTYDLTLGADQLTQFGKKESFDSGRSFYERYQALAGQNDPFIRTIGENRVVESVSLWKRGFYHSMNDNKPHDTTGHIHIIPKTKGFNNTLNHGLCRAFEKDYATRAKEAQSSWLLKFTQPITLRLNKVLPGAHLTATDTVYLMQLCPMNTVVNGIKSEFCNLFTAEEWMNYEYYETLGKYYGWSYGNPLGPTQGVGFTNELIARLTQQPVVDHTSTNSTLTRDPATFPLNKKIYADFTRGNTMVAIYSAMGLYKDIQPLSKTRRTSAVEAGGFQTSWLIPFASRMYVEKMKCDKTDEEMVRVLVNDRVMPLSGCGADKLGRCTLGRFVESMKFARRGGHWNKCFD
ncbi:histidine acid phosphatase [Colletotrichum navitas]|uniref:Phytase A n=1 Tax=Colletotrichum navitas TaxID=681940 RepID=A0AAD8PIQ6_9PEZI|nr:histidine acid phosphatase [Colletotrichum navitas]KAK1563969.1 histidine acid phosphatase [Colletotrichum navitas]